MRTEYAPPSRYAPAWWLFGGLMVFGAGLELYTRGDGAWQTGMPQPPGPHLGRYVIGVTVTAAVFLLWRRAAGGAVWVTLAGGWLLAASIYSPFRPAVLVPLVLVALTGAAVSGGRWLASDEGRAWWRNRARRRTAAGAGEPPGPVVLPEPATVTVPIPRDQTDDRPSGPSPAPWAAPVQADDRPALAAPAPEPAPPRPARPRDRPLILSRCGCSPR